MTFRCCRPGCGHRQLAPTTGRQLHPQSRQVPCYDYERGVAPRDAHTHAERRTLRREVLCPAVQGLLADRPVMGVPASSDDWPRPKVDPVCCQLRSSVNSRSFRRSTGPWSAGSGPWSAGVEVPGCAPGASRRVCAGVLMGLWCRCWGPGRVVGLVLGGGWLGGPVRGGRRRRGWAAAAWLGRVRRRSRLPPRAQQTQRRRAARHSGRWPSRRGRRG